MIKIYVRSLKIAVRHPKISVDSLKIAGLKIIARVCVCMCVYVCAPHFAEVSKIVQDAAGAGTQATRATTTRARATTTEHKHQGESDHRKPRNTSARAPNTKKKIKKQ